MVPSRTSGASMLPPKSPGQSPAKASSPRGATATRPSIGWRSISIRFTRLFGISVTPTMRVVSRRQT